MADERDVRTDDPPGDVDPGEPIGVLASLTQEPRSGFMAGIRRRIGRKTLAGDTAHLWWAGLPFVLFEFLQMFFQLTQRADGKETSNGNDD